MMPMKLNKMKNYFFTNQVLLVKPFVGAEADSKPLTFPCLRLASYMAEASFLNFSTPQFPFLQVGSYQL